MTTAKKAELQTDSGRSLQETGQSFGVTEPQGKHYVFCVVKGLCVTYQVSDITLTSAMNLVKLWSCLKGN